MNGERQAAWGHLAALSSMLCFGLMSPMCKVAMQGGVLDGLRLATLRVSGAALLFGLLALCRPRERVALRDIPKLFLMSLCGMSINQFCYVCGMSFTSPTNGCVVATSTPIFTLLLAALFLHFRVTRRRALGMGLAAVGALVLILGSCRTGGLSGDPRGDALCLLAQFAAACYFVFFSDLLHRYSPITMMKWLFGLSAAIMLPCMLPHLLAAPWGELSMSAGAGAAYVVVGGSFVSYLLLMTAQQRLDGPTVATYNYVQPVVAASVGVGLGVDVLTGQKVFAVLLIGCGVWLVTHARRSGRRHLLRLLLGWRRRIADSN
ncbi:MAG: DMT family transporter [Akkermansia sp.]